MTYEEAIALIKSGKPLSKKKIGDITDLGYSLYYGKQGLERDPYKGVELYSYSAEHGDAVAEYNLGKEKVWKSIPAKRFDGTAWPNAGGTKTWMRLSLE